MSDNLKENLLAGSATFPDKLMESAFKQFTKGNSSKINTNANKALSETLRVVTVEAATRAAMEAKKEGDQKVQLHHLEKTMAQVLLDI